MTSSWKLGPDNNQNTHTKLYKIGSGCGCLKAEGHIKHFTQHPADLRSLFWPLAASTSWQDLCLGFHVSFRMEWFFPSDRFVATKQHKDQLGTERARQLCHHFGVKHLGRRIEKMALEGWFQMVMMIMTFSLAVSSITVDWFTGNFTGTPRYWDSENPCFPIKVLP